jgi:hypothetical protein
MPGLVYIRSLPPVGVVNIISLPAPGVMVPGAWSAVCTNPGRHPDATGMKIEI